MKKILLVLLLPAGIVSCHHKEKILVGRPLIDSLISHSVTPVIATQNQAELLFWLRRIDTVVPGYLNESRYAGCLVQSFRLFGVIDSLRKADSVLHAIDRNFNHKETSADMALVSLCITGHRFREADSLLQKAKQLGLRPYESHAASFDVAFELGNYFQARTELNAIQSPGDYGYYFRKSKIDHLDGELDSAISDMNKAALLAETNDYLKG
ncbi:MAG TPA: hypothetical protein VKQ52_11270, partial [Puia sp.]|nr:hypothetical protein [Puia sp.]